MRDITHLFYPALVPVKALLIRQHNQDDRNFYVEAMDVDARGKPLNVHPLADHELADFAAALNPPKKSEKQYLQPKGLLPTHVLYLDVAGPGQLVWYTPASYRLLQFSPGLGIPSGKAQVPPLVCMATKDELRLFALKKGTRTTLHSPLYDAPFFNMYPNGEVCMGTVEIDAGKAHSLEEFMSLWEAYFFNSYFSHLIQNHVPLKENIVQFWTRQIETGGKFPLDNLIKTRYTVGTFIR